MLFARSTTFQQRVFLGYSGLGAIQCGFTVYLLSRIPSAGSLLFGMTIQRLVMLGGIALLGGLFLALGLGAGLKHPWAERICLGWQTQLQKPSKWGGWAVGSILLLISGSFFTLITPEIAEPFAAANFLRLQPIALLVGGLAGQTLLALPLIRYGTNWREKLLENPELLRVAGLYGVFLLIAGGLDLYLSRVEPDQVGWNTLGTPLLDTQVFFVFVIGLLLTGVGMWSRKFLPAEKQPAAWKLDALIFLLLWMVAAVYWTSLPLTNNWYISAPRYPTFSFYPNSDGMVYDTTAQSLLIGEGYQSSHLPYPRRPLYDFFLFGLYLLKGQNYEGVVALQSMWFAIFPGLIYLMGKAMHSRLAGILAGMLVLLREGNAIALTGVITVSHSRMTMSDFPTGIGVALLAWIAFRWLTAPETPQRLRLILLAGGILAAAMQIRIETGVFIPILFGLALLQFPKMKSRYFTSLFAFVACMGLVITPWVYRNWKTTGLIYFEVPDARISFLLDRLRKTTEEEAPQVPTPTENSETEGGSGLKTRMPMPQAPTPTFLQVLVRHGVHSQTQALLLFPDTYRIFDSAVGFLGHKDPVKFWAQCCSGKNYVKRLPFWHWGKWSGEIPLQSVVPILVNLFILAVGFRQAWKKSGWNSLWPVGMALGYYFANALARTSGGRYLQPVDWVWIVYYSIGLATLIQGVFKLFGANPPSRLFVDAPETPSPRGVRPGWQPALAICAGFLLLGVAIPAAEKVYPLRYTEETMQTWLSEFSQADKKQLLAPHLDTFLANGGEILQGRSFYLRFYGANKGESGSLYPAVYARPFPRLSFFLVGPKGIGVFLPLEMRPSIQAQNATDVLVFGCMQAIEQGPYFEALALYYPETDELFLRTPFPETLACPLAEP